jgi:cell division control protein 24
MSGSLVRSSPVFGVGLHPRGHSLDRFYHLSTEQPVDAPRLDVVNHVWLSFRLGSSLCHLFNMLLPIFDPDAPPPIPIEFPDFDYPEEQGVLTWGTLPQNIKQCKRGAAKFIVTLTNLQKEARWPDSDPLWAIHELFRDDTGGLVKVLRTIGILLDKLPASAWVREESNSPSTPYPVERSGFLTGSQETFLGSHSTAAPGHSSTSSQGQPFTRPPSSASIHHPSHRSQLSTASSHGVPRSGLDTPPLQGAMPTSGPVGLTRPGPGLFINTSLDRSKSYSGSNGTIPGTATPDLQPHLPSSALPQLETRQGDVRPVDCGQAAMHVWEILKTEKKYVQELEILQAYSQSLLQHSLVAPDTVHLIFSNLGKLLDFQVGPKHDDRTLRLKAVLLTPKLFLPQRRFLTQLETQYEPVVESGGNAWVEGNWGYPWVSMVCARRRCGDRRRTSHKLLSRVLGKGL